MDFVVSLVNRFVYSLPDYVVPEGGWPDPRGLLMGLWGVLIGQAVVLAYYTVVRFVWRPKTIQFRLPPQTTLAADVWGHVAQPESFAMVFGYLFGVWMWRLLPASYYDLEAGPQFLNVAAQFVAVDLFTYTAHVVEHSWPALYIRSHKPHHRFVNPKLYNAFNGSVLDTFTLILVPLFCTAQVCRFCSCWDFMVFGCLYAAQFTLIHSEFSHPWDPLLAALGIGTAEDHNVHHLLFKYNYSHFTMWWDIMFGTYKAPVHVKQFQSFIEHYHKVE